MDGETKPAGDALPEGGQPSGGEGSPSVPPGFISEEDVNKRHAKLDKTIAQLNRELTEARQSYESTTAELTALRRQIDDAEAERYKDDPTQLSLYERQRKQRERDAALAAREKTIAQREAKIKADEEEVAKIKTDAVIAKLTAKYKLPENSLSGLGITDPEALAKVAVVMAANRLKAGAGDFNPDSGLTKGGATEPTQEQIDKMTDVQYREWASKRYKTNAR